MTSKRTTLKTQLRNGELNHVVVVAGKPVQAHTSLKAAMAALLLAMALTGCATTNNWVETHPRTSTFLAASLALSAYGMSRDHGHGPIQHDVQTPAVACANGSCK